MNVVFLSVFGKVAVDLLIEACQESTSINASYIKLDLPTNRGCYDESISLPHPSLSRYSYKSQQQPLSAAEVVKKILKRLSWYIRETEQRIEEISRSTDSYNKKRLSEKTFKLNQLKLIRDMLKGEGIEDLKKKHGEKVLSTIEHKANNPFQEEMIRKLEQELDNTYADALSRIQKMTKQITAERDKKADEIRAKIMSVKLSC